MTETKRKNGLIALGLAVTAWLSANALAGLPYNGVVLEEGTDKPLAGATVVLKWSADGGIVDARTYCVTTAMTKTDEQGKFSFSFSIRAFLSRDTQSSIAVYAPGHVQLREPAALREPINSVDIDKDPERKKRLYAKEALLREWAKKMQANYDAGIFRVEKVEDLDAKLAGYGDVLSTAHCYTGPDDINRDEIDLAKKILLEVAPLPTSPSQKEWVAWLRTKVEEMEKKRGLR